MSCLPFHLANSEFLKRYDIGPVDNSKPEFSGFQTHLKRHPGKPCQFNICIFELSEIIQTL